MHSCLTISEVVQLIFEQCKEPRPQYFPRPKQDLKTFASLAVTCRAFRNPALDILWSEQETVRNVLKTLPPHLWVERKESNGPDVWDIGLYFRIVCSIKPEDWTVPLSYARRIKKLSLRDDMGDKAHFPDVDIFKAIASALAEHFFPNVRELDWTSQESVHLPFLDLFLGPNLQSARIILSRFDSSLPDNLAILHLKKLNFHCHRSSPAVLRAASDLVMRLERIEELVVPCLDQDAVEYLSRLPSLRSPEFSRVDMASGLDPSPNSSPEATPAHSPPFPTLRSVKFESALPASIIECLAMLPVDSQVGSFDTFVDEDAAEKSLASLFTELSTHFSPASLRTLKVKSNAEKFNDIQQLGHRSEFTPLFSFHNLTKLSLILPITIEIDDAMAWDCATSWPNLVDLEMREPGAGLARNPPPMTMGAFRAFATHCHQLKHLTLTVDGSSIPPEPVNDNEELPSLPFLNVGPSPIRDAGTVSIFLDDLFPNLRSIHCQDWRWDGYTAGGYAYDEEPTEPVRRARLHFKLWKAVQTTLRTWQDEDDGSSEEGDEQEDGGE
ncbi:hypothetical protein FB45DRAFT_894800 [Roridomyces roridus]|uniref:F-box domain-containing protein n=1 Tax=Roridomyces roridus TaxID=1738132 RepID=A0AAD7FZQ9_9AGAR|nr:hypothetical protein FB45DRAFT_894800 [Roridomyces roridus]